LQQVGKIINGHQDLFVAIGAHRCDLASYFDSLGGVSVYGYDGGWSVKNALTHVECNIAFNGLENEVGEVRSVPN